VTAFAIPLNALLGQNVLVMLKKVAILLMNSAVAMRLLLH
jgi:hypothetical protein